MFRRHLDMRSEIKTRGSLLDPADSNSGLNNPENDGRSFSEKTLDPLRRAFRRKTSGTTPARFGETTSKTTRAPFWETGPPAFQGSFRDEPVNNPQNDLGVVLKTPAVDLAGSFRENDLEGRFITTHRTVNIRNYHILPYSLMK
jgi:hypothetical protein